ncbi:hypothetical protein KF840_23555 [bacterium]|nr:hypothetical protein [bacterium]
MGSLLGLAALIAAIAVALRALRRRAAERAQPGRSPERAIAIHDYGEMDFAIGLQTCPCGGRYALRGEGPDATPRLRVAHLACRRCEREVALYFDVSQVLH